MEVLGNIPEAVILNLMAVDKDYKVCELLTNLHSFLRVLFSCLSSLL